MSTLFIQYNYCANDYYDTDGRDSKCVLELYNGDSVELFDSCSSYTTVDTCTDSSRLNLTINDYSLMMGLSANFLAFTMVFLVGFLFVLQGRR